MEGAPAYSDFQQELVQEFGLLGTIAYMELQLDLWNIAQKPQEEKKMKAKFRALRFRAKAYGKSLIGQC